MDHRDPKHGCKELVVSIPLILAEVFCAFSSWNRGTDQDDWEPWFRERLFLQIPETFLNLYFREPVSDIKHVLEQLPFLHSCFTDILRSHAQSQLDPHEVAILVSCLPFQGSFDGARSGNFRRDVHRMS